MAKPSELLLRYAECSDGESSYDSAVEDEFYNGQDPWDENPYKGRVFHKFAELPPEMRIKIWELGLSGLSQPQLLEFSLKSVVRKDPGDLVPDESGMPSPRRYRDWTINGSPSLACATELNRSVMAANREARDVALKLLPHTLKIRTPAGDGIVHFDRNRDIVQLSGYTYEVMHPFPIEERFQDFIYHFDGFAENVVQLVVHYNAFFDEDEDTSEYFTLALQQFQNLKRLFLLSAPDKFMGQDILWCGSNYIYVHTSMITDGRNEPLWTNWCWPNADEYDDFARNQVSEPVTHLLPASALPLLRTRGIELFPMVIFEDKYGLDFLKKLKRKWGRTYAEGTVPSDSELSSNEEEEEEWEPDEYESDGIDDSPIEENRGHDDSGDDIFDEEYDSANDDYSGAGEAEIVPVFSSPEPEPGVDGGATNSRKRRIVLDSDDEDGDTSERSGRKHARTGSFTEPDGGTNNAFGGFMGAARRQKRATFIDSDNGEDGGANDDALSRLMSTARRQKRAVIVDSDNDEEDGGGASSSKPGEQEQSKKEEERQADKLVETNDDKDEEDEEEIIDVRRLSLASRLQKVRESHPSSDEGSDGDEDSDNINDDEDDEDEDEDEDEEMYGGGLVDGDADESDGSGGY